MDQTEFRALTRRLLSHVENGTTDQAPATFSVPVADYFEPGRCHPQAHEVFVRVPLVVASPH